MTWENFTGISDTLTKADLSGSVLESSKQVRVARRIGFHNTTSKDNAVHFYTAQNNKWNF